MKNMGEKPRLTKVGNRWYCVVPTGYLVPENDQQLKVVKVPTRNGNVFRATLLNKDNFYSRAYETFYTCAIDWTPVPENDNCKCCSQPIESHLSLTITVVTHVSADQSQKFPTTSSNETVNYCRTCARIMGDALAALGFTPTWLLRK